MIIETDPYLNYITQLSSLLPFHIVILLSSYTTSGVAGPTGPTLAGVVVYDGGEPDTDFSVGLNINCGGVS